jgi:DNA polymerase III alpha subunit (gram-positive type)
MILLSLDFETTGLDTSNDEVIEFGGVLYSTGQHKCLDSQGILVKTNKTLTQEITSITGVTQPALDRFGYDQDTALDAMIDLMAQADHIIGYNVRRFDYRVAQSWAARHARTLPSKIWIDLFQDLPYNVPTGKLSHLAADHGILNLFPHSAMSDCQTVLAVASKYDPELLLTRAQSPVVVLRARADRNQNDLVKKAKFRWNPANKIWWRAAKEQDVTEIIQSVQFPVSIEKQWTPEELD